MAHMSLNTFELQSSITKGHAGVKAKMALIACDTEWLLSAFCERAKVPGANTG
jgi:hypothetical protein